MKIAIHGYGKMGQTIERVAKGSGHEVVCVMDIGRNDPLSGAEVMIDFSNASALEHAAGPRQQPNGQGVPALQREACRTVRGS